LPQKEIICGIEKIGAGQTDYSLMEKDNLLLVKKDKSEVGHTRF